MKRLNHQRSLVLLSTVLLFIPHRGVSLSAVQENLEVIAVPGPGIPPQLEFACCEHGTGQMQSLFAQPGLIKLLKDLHATVAIPTVDFSQQRADVVRTLSQQGIPVVGWILLPKEQGYYLTADAASQAAARLADFEKWTRIYNLRWAAIGLDIEPNFAELTRMRQRPWRLITTFLGRSVNIFRARRNSLAFSMLVNHIRSDGYPVQIYQMPYVPAERAVHSSLPDRLLGTVDIGGDQEYLMLYTSYARPIGAGMIWALGSHAQGIAIGSTDGDTAAGIGNGPLQWQEFSRDLIVASHFTNKIGVYDLEGSVRQGFLPKLLTIDWSQPVAIPKESLRRAARFGFIVRSVLWLGSNSVYLVSAGFLLAGWALWRRRGQDKGSKNRD